MNMIQMRNDKHNYFQPNLGMTDRVVRIGIGIGLIAWAIIYRSPLLALFGIFALYEAFASWCILWAALGRNTCPISRSKNTAIPFMRIFLLGWVVFGTALLLNIFAQAVGWVSWHSFIGQGMPSLSLDNYIFLFAVYPFALGIPVLLVGRSWPSQ